MNDEEMKEIEAGLRYYAERDMRLRNRRMKAIRAALRDMRATIIVAALTMLVLWLWSSKARSEYRAAMTSNVAESEVR